MSVASGQASLKATIGYGTPASSDSSGERVVPSMTATLLGPSPATPPTTRILLDDDDDPLSATMAAPAASAPVGSAPVTAGPVTRIGTVAGRTTILPRRKVAPGAPTERPRFDRVKLLGQGGMGEVALARDNDIRRTVAVKYLRPDVSSSEALLRFADEIRVVGQLEHPAIVPVYDVGIDDQGQHFLVMKHLSGETMESVIDKLRAGDPEATKRFTFEHRAHLFLQVLEAIRYAHARGIVHRDLKPANIMIGPYGEVTVMDWGIAKPIPRERAREGSAVVNPLDHTARDANAPGSHGGRLLETQLGALAGTPLYMSPEQAAGRNDDIDERSDVYTLGVVLLEWMALFHPLDDKKSLTEVLGSLVLNDYDEKVLGMRAMKTGMPVEYIQLVSRVLRRDREQRLQSVEVFEQQLRDILDGNVLVKCHATFAKSAAHRFTHWIDRHPILFWVLFHGGAALTILSLLGAIGWGAYQWLT